MEVDIEYWNVGQTRYLMKCFGLGRDFGRSLVLSRIWKNVVKWGCVYDRDITQECFSVIDYY